jgi:hypothetical protein
MTLSRKHRDRLRAAPVCKEAYRKPKRNPKSAPNIPRPPRSRRSALLAHPGLTDSTGGLGPSLARTRSQDRPARLRFLACVTPPGRPQDHLPARARSAADLSPVLPSSAPRMSPRPGIFGGSPPSRARGRQTWPPCCRRSPRSSQMLQVANLTTAPGSGRIITGRLNGPLCLRK